MKEIKAHIFNIQHYSLHDGPGIRTVIFFKGCPLRCRWCCNPESQKFESEISFQAEKCLGAKACGYCRNVCTENALEVIESHIRVDFSRCTGCQKCSKVCPAQALKEEGKWYKTEELLDIAEKDQIFYHRNNGGITISGGEVLSQPEALLALLKGAEKRHLHTGIETCGQGNYEVLYEAMKYLDFLYYDVKSLDSGKHKLYTGKGNEVILSNIKKICEAYPNKPKRIRTPVIPGFNDSREELQKIKEFALSLPGTEHEFLPYHSFGKGKYQMLGRDYEMGDVKLKEGLF